MKFNVEFENTETKEKWTVELDTTDEATAEVMAEAMCKDTPLMFEVRSWS